MKEYLNSAIFQRILKNKKDYQRKSENNVNEMNPCLDSFVIFLSPVPSNVIDPESLTFM